MSPKLVLREFRGGFWTEWYVRPPICEGTRFRATRDEWLDDPLTGQPLRRIWEWEPAEPADPYRLIAVPFL